MSDKFQNKYRIPSARASWWDYSRDGTYFITICTQDRDCYFGKVVNGKMKLTGIGEIALSCWQEIPQHFPYVQLDSFMVMPNHVHGIIIIDKPVEYNSIHKSAGGTVPVETLHATSLPAITPTSMPNSTITPSNATELPFPINPSASVKNQHMADISPKQGTLGSIVRSYKSAVTNETHLIHAEISWQARYYDSIIRDDQSWQTISEYIIHNPAKWEDDKFYIQ